MICTDFKFLYEYFVKLKIIYEKRLMIDVMNFRQSYEKREIIEIRWIDENNNSVDFITKIKTSSILKILIDSNRINFNAIQWIERSDKSRMSKNKKNWINQKKNDLIDQIDFEEFFLKIMFQIWWSKIIKTEHNYKTCWKKFFYFIQKNSQC